MMKKSRQLHLWIGLITSVLILMESITGLLMSEPWLIGAQSQGKGHVQMQMQGQAVGSAGGSRGNGSNVQGQAAETAQPAAAAASSETNKSQPSNANGQAPGIQQAGASMSVMSVIKGLHEGRLPNGANAKYLIDITAISMIVLTVTGIFMSIKILRAQSRSRKRAGAANAKMDLA